MLRWIGARTPPAVMSLEPWLGGDPGQPSDEPAEVLTEAACEALRRSLERPGRVRESAFHLLAADALLTYACEAALDAGDPERCLERILESTLGR